MAGRSTGQHMLPQQALKTNGNSAPYKTKKRILCRSQAPSMCPPPQSPLTPRAAAPAAACVAGRSTGQHMLPQQPSEQTATAPPTKPKSAFCVVPKLPWSTHPPTPEQSPKKKQKPTSLACPAAGRGAIHSLACERIPLRHRSNLQRKKQHRHSGIFRVADLRPGTMPRGKYPESPAPAGSHALISRTPTPGGMLHANLGLPRPPPRNFQPPLPQQPPKQTQQRRHNVPPVQSLRDSAAATPVGCAAWQTTSSFRNLPRQRAGSPATALSEIHTTPPRKIPRPAAPATGRARPCIKGKPSPNFGLGFHEAVHTPLLDGGIISQKYRMSAIFSRGPQKNPPLPRPAQPGELARTKKRKPGLKGRASLRRCTAPYSMGELYCKNLGCQPFLTKIILPALLGQCRATSEIHLFHPALWRIAGCFQGNSTPPVPPPPQPGRARPCKGESPARNSGWAFMGRCTRPLLDGGNYTAKIPDVNHF